MATIRYQFTNDTTAKLTASNPDMKKGEPVFDSTAGRLKLGNGVDRWNGRAYLAPDVVNNLTTGGNKNALSAQQGKELKALLDGKADSSQVSALQTTLNTKADTTDVNTLSTNINAKANTTDVNTLSSNISAKADTTDVNTLSANINAKVSKSEANTLSSNINTKASTTDVNALQTKVNQKAAKTTVTALETRIKTIEDKNGLGGIPEAPKDGNKYVRCKGAWVKYNPLPEWQVLSGPKISNAFVNSDMIWLGNSLAVLTGTYQYDTSVTWGGSNGTSTYNPRKVYCSYSINGNSWSSSWSMHESYTGTFTASFFLDSPSRSGSPYIVLPGSDPNYVTGTATELSHAGVQVFKGSYNTTGNVFSTIATKTSVTNYTGIDDGFYIPSIGKYVFYGPSNVGSNGSIQQNFFNGCGIKTSSSFIGSWSSHVFDGPYDSRSRVIWSDTYHKFYFVNKGTIYSSSNGVSWSPEQTTGSSISGGIFVYTPDGAKIFYIDGIHSYYTTDGKNWINLYYEIWPVDTPASIYKERYGVGHHWFAYSSLYNMFCTNDFYISIGGKEWKRHAPSGYYAGSVHGCVAVCWADSLKSFFALNTGDYINGTLSDNYVYKLDLSNYI